MSKKRNNRSNNNFRNQNQNQRKDISPMGRAMIESVTNLKDVEFSSDFDEKDCKDCRKPYNKDQDDYNYVNSPIE